MGLFGFSAWVGCLNVWFLIVGVCCLVYLSGEFILHWLLWFGVVFGVGVGGVVCNWWGGLFGFWWFCLLVFVFALGGWFCGVFFCLVLCFVGYFVGGLLFLLVVVYYYIIGVGVVEFVWGGCLWVGCIGLFVGFCLLFGGGFECLLVVVCCLLWWFVIVGYGVECCLVGLLVLVCFLFLLDLVFIAWCCLFGL